MDADREIMKVEQADDGFGQAYLNTIIVAIGNDLTARKVTERCTEMS